MINFVDEVEMIKNAVNYAMISGMPIEDLILNIGNKKCKRCKRLWALTNEKDHCYELSGKLYCEECTRFELEDMGDEAFIFAEENCKVSDVDEFSNLAHNRHNNSNYDTLLEGLDRYDTKDRFYYSIIRDYINYLIKNKGI